jgi:hypothetical protein
MNNDERKKVIIDYISVHQGCTREQIDRQKDEVPISRVKIFRLVDELVKDNSVIKVQERVNSRNHKLYVNSNNLLVSVPRELDEFELNYMNLIKESNLKLIDKEDSPDAAAEYIPDVIYKLFEIFFIMVDCYLAKVTLVWPYIVSDRGTFEKLLRLVFTKITKLQLNLYEFKTNHSLSLHASIPNRDLAEALLDETIDQRLGRLRKLLAEGLSIFYPCGLIKEFDTTIDSLWDVTSDFHHHKDWRELLDLDWVLKHTIFIPNQYEEYDMKDVFSVYPYFSTNSKKRNEEARIHQIRKYGSLLNNRTTNSLDSEKGFPITETGNIAHTSKNNRDKSKMKEFEIPCIFCEHKNYSEFDLGIHYEENHQEDLMKLSFNGDKEVRIEFAILKGKTGYNIKNILP